MVSRSKTAEPMTKATKGSSKDSDDPTLPVALCGSHDGDRGTGTSPPLKSKALAPQTLQSPLPKPDSGSHRWPCIWSGATLPR